MAARAPERRSPPSAVLFFTFLFANAFLFEDIIRPVTGVVPGFASVYTLDYGAQTAVALVVMVSLVLMVLVFRRGNVPGLTAGAVKG